MPIITFVVGYVYLVFGSFKVFNSLGFEFVLSCFSTSILTIIATWHVMGIAKSLSENMITKLISLLLFASFGYLLNIGAGRFPVFSVSDPFYWSRNRPVSPSYDRAFKTISLGLLSYCFANTSPFWHSVAASCFILLDVILMVHHWEIAGLDDWENPVQEQRNINDPEDSLIEDLHMD